MTAGLGNDAVTAAVRHVTSEDLGSLPDIVLGLSDYFTEDVPEKVLLDATSHPAWVLEESRHVVGFAIVDDGLAPRPRFSGRSWR
jgi:hypothetical protein